MNTASNQLYNDEVVNVTHALQLNVRQIEYEVNQKWGPDEVETGLSEALQQAKRALTIWQNTSTEEDGFADLRSAGLNEIASIIERRAWSELAV